MDNIALEYKNVSKRFEGNSYDSVSNVNIQIKEHDFVTVLGTSGSGKTTLLKMANRIHEVTAGNVEFFGKDIYSLDINEYRRQIGYVIQQGGLFPHKNVEENIAIVPNLLKWDKERIRSRVKELLDLVQLDYEIYRKRYPKSLSGGEQQRVGIARALAVNPKLMLMDEPFGAIDAITREVLQKEMLNLHKKIQNTILFVTHDISEAFALGQKIIIMDSGKVQQFDTPYNIIMNPKNDFVKKLVFSGGKFDMIRRISVENVVQPVNGEEIQTGKRIDTHNQLDNVLMVMLQEEVPYVVVENENKEIVGKITMDRIRRILR